MENELDEIADGKREYVKTLSDFYKPFIKDVNSKKDTEKITNLGDAPEEFRCPKCNANMIIKLGKTGKFLSCSLFPNCNGGRTIDGKELEGPKETGENCPKCNSLTFDAHYKFIKLKDVSDKYVRMYFLLLKTGHYWDSLPEDSSSKHIGVRLIEDEGRYFWVLNFQISRFQDKTGAYAK